MTHKMNVKGDKVRKIICVHFMQEIIETHERSVKTKYGVLESTISMIIHHFMLCLLIIYQ